jgi:hypothetical protein
MSDTTPAAPHDAMAAALANNAILAAMISLQARNTPDPARAMGDLKQLTLIGLARAPGNASAPQPLQTDIRDRIEAVFDAAAEILANT